MELYLFTADWCDWCHPCLLLKRDLEALDVHPDVVVDVADEEARARRWLVTQVPTLLVVAAETEIDRLEGYRGLKQTRAFLEEHRASL